MIGVTTVNNSVMMLLVFICLQILAGNIVEMAGDGAKRSACVSMFPRHYVKEQNGGCPYVLSVSSMNYYPLANITVTVKSNDLTGFKGFLCQARRELEEYVTYGKLTPAGNVNMANNCEQNASLTHTESSFKPFVSFIWTAPEMNAGDISIVCTIVQQFSIFWTNVTSPKIRFSDTVTQSTTKNSLSTEPLITPLSSLSPSSTKSTIRPASSSKSKSTASPTSSARTKSTIRPASSSKSKSTASPTSSARTKYTINPASSPSSSVSAESSVATSTVAMNTTKESTFEPTASSGNIIYFIIHEYFILVIVHIYVLYFAT